LTFTVVTFPDFSYLTCVHIYLIDAWLDKSFIHKVC
jgi:hypothetical protein